MSIQTRTPQQFRYSKIKGQLAEKEFMELIALMGGTASSLGKVPAHTDQTPRFSRPHEAHEDGFCYSVSPDILFTLPDRPRGFACLAQIKVKKLQTEAAKQWLYIFLDEKELHRMSLASNYYHVFFVVNIPELENISGFSDWMWVNIDELKLSNKTLLKRKVCNKPTFLIPLNIFKPLSEITQINLKNSCDAIRSTVSN